MDPSLLRRDSPLAPIQLPFWPPLHKPPPLLGPEGIPRSPIHLSIPCLCYVSARPLPSGWCVSTRTGGDGEKRPLVSTLRFVVLSPWILFSEVLGAGPWLTCCHCACFNSRYCSRSSCGTGLGQARDKEGAAPSGGSALVDTCPGPEPTLYLVNGLSVNSLMWTAVSCCRPSPGLALPLHGLLSL